ncbi:MAG: DUF4382 domain-containing protein [Bacteroidota bacterium]
MRSYTRLFLSLLLCGFLSFSISGCNLSQIIASLYMDITDAPIDDPLYQDVYITIAGLEVNGKKLEDFGEKQTIKISELQAGVTAQLVNAEVAAGEYDNITLILDYDEDVDGTAPGCYAMTSYERKIDLANGKTGEQKISLTKALNLSADEEVNLVIDFDLRKSIRSSQPGDESELVFVEGNDLVSALRVVDKAEAGTIKGTLLSELPSSSAVNTYVIYAYKPEDFNKDTERFDSDGDGIAFEKAVTSTLVTVLPGRSENFSLHYLEAGTYTLVIEAYESEEFYRYPVGYLKTVGAEVVGVPVNVKVQEETTINLTGIGVVP